jgi:hypothetical protein
LPDIPDGFTDALQDTWILSHLQIVSAAEKEQTEDQPALFNTCSFDD